MFQAIAGWTSNQIQTALAISHAFGIPSAPVNIADDLAALGLFGAFLTYILSAVGSYFARRREGAIKAIEQIRSFEQNVDVRQALHIIDYPQEASKLPYALRVHAKSAQVDNTFGKEMSTREAVDRMLAQFDLLEGLIRHRVMSKREFGTHFHYWLQLMCERPLPTDTVRHLKDAEREALWKFIRYYEFRGVIRLFNLYGRAACVGMPAEKAFRPRIIEGQPAHRQ